MKSYKILSTGIKSVLETPEVNIKQETVLACEHFLHSPQQRRPTSEWDLPDSCYDHMQLERSVDTGPRPMRGSVSSLSDAADVGQCVLDSLILECDRINDSHFDILEGYCFLWESFKDDDMSPTSTSNESTSTRLASAPTTTDEDAISSSSRQCDSVVPFMPLPKAKNKSSMDSPPDDVGAFFGHPLTRATNALNGEGLDTNASAVALLHEYISIPPLEREDIKGDDKLNGLLEIIGSSQHTDPPMSTATEVNVSPLPTSVVVAPEPGAQEIFTTMEDEVESVSDGDYLFPEYNLNKYLLCGNQADSPTDGKELTNVGTRCTTRSKSTKDMNEVRGSALQKKVVGRRAPRRSRAKTDVVTSTTSCVTTPLGSEGALTLRGPSASGHQQLVGAGDFTKYTHQFETKGAVVKKEEEVAVVTNAGDEQGSSTPTPASPYVVTTHGGLSSEPQLLFSSATDLPQTALLHHPDHIVELDHLSSDSHLLTVVAHPSAASRTSGSPSDLVSTTAPVSTPSSPSGEQHLTTTYTSGDPKTKDGSDNGLPYDQLIKENNFLKRALSEKIRSRQSTEETANAMPAHSLQFLTDDVHGSVLEPKFAPMASIKQEHQSYMNYVDPQFYDSEMIGGQLTSLGNGMAMNSCANAGHGMVSITMATCEDAMSGNDSHNMNGLANGAVHSLYGSALDHHDHRHPQHLSQADQGLHDAMIVQSAGQYFQVLQPLQPMETHQPLESQVSSTNQSVTSNVSNNYYNSYMYPRGAESDKHVVLECYPPQTKYQNSHFQNFLTTDSYNMKSPDSGYHEPCLSPGSMLKESALNGTAENIFKDKPKKKKSPGSGAPTGPLLRQYSSSGSDKMNPKSPAIPKLEVNATGYSYFLETPISTTQRKDEDKVTYLNKSQYYGLTLNFDSQERFIKCAVVKSVIILAFREEKTMEEERKAWEFWHGRQHSYKQRILDIDTKNCQGVLPHNIEEIAFNAVAVRWNPMEGPVRVNIAVHCLSTDFSNQKGVKGIPLHVQIDTYEQSPKDNHLVHRGYCQIKAFCDKGAERKTRDEERRRVAKNKPEDFGTSGTKSRKKAEEAFHDPCDRSEFYSMADMTTPPVFFNPLHETAEFIHKSITLGVVPTQEEEISSLPTSLELPDSCDDYYTSSPAKRPRRDSINVPKDAPKVLLYVREHHEEVYTALMLEIPTLHGLLKSIEQKYSISPSRVKNLYKKSRKGILVRLDDNIVRHYSHESTFIIEKNLINDDKDYEIILIEIDPPTT
uniref:Grh/CP2 DB domain-containing protein n=1 Tax=Biomphalaria glabrata TaxID=6526 RepID=A0A2C9JH45_BIOGL